MLHVVSICTPCYMLLGVVVQNKRVKRLSQQHPTFLLLRGHQSLAQQCWISLHSSSNIVGATHMHHHTWSPKSYGVCPSHDTLHVPTLLGVVASACKQLPTQLQQLPTLLAQQCLDLLRPSACSFKVKNITSLIFFQVLLKAMTFLSLVWNYIFFYTCGFQKILYVLFGKKIGWHRSSFVDFSFLFMIKLCNKLKIKFPDFSGFGKN